mgnify:CR=1 FL=1
MGFEGVNLSSSMFNKYILSLARCFFFIGDPEIPILFQMFGDQVLLDKREPLYDMIEIPFTKLPNTHWVGINAGNLRNLEHDDN